MDLRTKLIILYDYYCNLLTENQREYFEDYYFNNYSLSEISENNNISRNGVYKVIKECEKKLLYYEEKLELYKKRNRILKKIELLSNNETKEIVKKIMEDI